MQEMSSVELPDQGDGIIRTPDCDIVPNPAGVGCEIFHHLTKHDGDIIAQIDAETGEEDKYDDFRSRVLRVALTLRERGVKPGDIVAPCTSNHFNTAVVFFAPLLIGAKVACFDSNGVYADNKFLVDLVKPKVMFADESAVEDLEKIKEELNLDMEIVVFGETKKYTPFEDYLKPFPKDEEDNFEPHRVENLFETALITFSSGSTGTPKGLCINHFAMLSQLMRLITYNFSMGLVYSPLAWASGQMIAIINLIMGTPRLICWNFTPEKTWNYLIKYNPSGLTLTPQDTMTFLKYGNPQKLETPNLKAMFAAAGGKPSVEVMAALSKLFLNRVFILTGYGQSEIYGTAFAFDIPFLLRKPGCVGKPTEGYWYKVVDPETEEICGPNQEGELRIKSRFCMSGYYNLDSSDRFDADDFLKTGDVAYYDDEHGFYIVERLGERLKYKSRWIPPTLLESILYEHSAVKVACVIGIVAGDGDIATGVVVKKAEVSEEELVKFVNDKVDEYKKIRGGIIFVDEDFVPYTCSGKVRRFMLRKKVLETYEDDIKRRIPTYISSVRRTR